MTIWRLRRAQKALGGVLEGSWGALGDARRVLGCPWGAPGDPRGACGWNLDPPFGVLGGPWVVLGGSWSVLGGPFGTLFFRMGASGAL